MTLTMALLASLFVLSALAGIPAVVAAAAEEVGKDTALLSPTNIALLVTALIVIHLLAFAFWLFKVMTTSDKPRMEIRKTK